MECQNRDCDSQGSCCYGLREEYHVCTNHVNPFECSPLCGTLHGWWIYASLAQNSSACSTLTLGLSHSLGRVLRRAFVLWKAEGWLLKGYLKNLD